MHLEAVIQWIWLEALQFNAWMARPQTHQSARRIWNYMENSERLGSTYRISLQVFSHILLCVSMFLV